MVRALRSLAVLSVLVLLLVQIPASGAAVPATPLGDERLPDDSVDPVVDGLDETTETVNGTTDEVNETTDGTTDEINDGTTDEAVDEGDETGNGTADLIDGGNETVDGTTNEVNETTNEVNETTNEVNETTDGGAVDTDGTDGTVDETADDIGNGTADTVQAEVTRVDEAVNATSNAVNETVDGVGDDVADADVTGTADRLTGVDADAAVNDTADSLAAAAENATTTLDTSSGTTLTDFEDDTGELTALLEDPLAETGENFDVAADTGAGSEDGSQSSPGAPAASRLGTGSGDADTSQKNIESSDDGSAGGNGLPGERAGSGVALGAVAVGAMLFARRVGAAAVLSSAAGSGGSVLAAIVSLLRTWGHRLLLLIGYKRYSDDDPLEHGTRKRLYDRIRASPGTYLAELSEETGVEMGTVRYHLRILEFENLVSEETIRGHRRYFPAGTDWAELEAALNDDATAAIVEALERDGPDSVSGLAETLDRDPSTISHHLDRLAEDGLVERERQGRAVQNKLSADVQRALDDDGDVTAATGEPVPGQAD